MCTILFEEPLEVVCIDEVPTEAVQYCLSKGTLPIAVNNTYNAIGITYLHDTHKMIVLLEEFHDVKISWGLKWFRTKETNRALYTILEDSGWYAISEYLRKNN